MNLGTPSTKLIEIMARHSNVSLVNQETGGDHQHIKHVGSDQNQVTSLAGGAFQCQMPQVRTHSNPTCLTNTTPSSYQFQGDQAGLAKAFAAPIPAQGFEDSANWRLNCWRLTTCRRLLRGLLASLEHRTSPLKTNGQAALSFVARHSTRPRAHHRPLATLSSFWTATTPGRTRPGPRNWLAESGLKGR